LRNQVVAKKTFHTPFSLLLDYVIQIMELTKYVFRPLLLENARLPVKEKSEHLLKTK
jgi:hypothetical protein